MTPKELKKNEEKDESCMSRENVDRYSPYSCRKGRNKNGKNMCCPGYVCACGSEEISIKDM